MTEAEWVEKNGVKGAVKALALLRGILKRQDGQNAPGDGDELYVFCEAFKTLDAHIRQFPPVWARKA